ncbi:DNA-deoxyinosine glycosylase [Desulfuribacillus alkaliarsenatis]|uniref:DNA-deoxyinosine glycosylase n=2 Tax=Desulfuribacillus alkaliarsenatis TaxID=766136 RepID=A0A1E5FZ08_9FIRM|nr:DNA-deoxyinosine glycosylase [Desulfuribacillus alkaliarsenatis]
MEFINSFRPIIDKNSKILILGSMPGVQSLANQQYYAHPRNHFWNILFNLFDLPLSNEYTERIKLLHDKGIALWDVLESCTREGSLDSKIKHENANDFHALFKEYPNIRAVLFNGGKAYTAFKKHVGLDFNNLEFIQLPSTSPANTMNFEEKLIKWSFIKKYF